MPVTSRPPTQPVTRNVVVEGTYDIMFDRYPGDNKTKLEPWQKLYIIPGTRVISLPALNIMSFFTAHNTNSAPKRLRDTRQFKKIANAIQSFVQFGPPYIPFTRDGKPIEFGQLVEEQDELSGVYIHHAVGRLDKGIPNPNARPVLPLPWSLAFQITYTPNKEVQEQEVQNLLDEGGRAIGFGTWRGLFGKFRVLQWE